MVKKALKVDSCCKSAIQLVDLFGRRVQEGFNIVRSCKVFEADEPTDHSSYFFIKCRNER